MTYYTIGITPDDDHEPTTIIRVRLGGPEPLIESISTTSTNGGFRPDHVPAVDAPALVSALAAAMRPQPAATTISVEPKPAAVPAAKKRNAPAKRPAAKTARKAVATKTTTAPAGSRNYRTTPTDLVEVYARVGTINALAEHYEVPRHTAQGWVSRLRRQGKLPGGHGAVPGKAPRP